MGKASFTVDNLNNHLNSLKIDNVDNSTIGKECLGKKGLHFTIRGTGELAINFINKIRSLQQLTSSFKALDLSSPVTVSTNDADTPVSQNSQFKEQSENQNLADNVDEILHHLKFKNVNMLVIGHLNINSLCNKFDSLKLLVKNSLDVFMISETKLDKTFPEAKLLMDGFTPPYRMDRNTNGGAIVLYVREDITSRQISFKNGDKNIEHFFC